MVNIISFNNEKILEKNRRMVLTNFKKLKKPTTLVIQTDNKKIFEINVTTGSKTRNDKNFFKNVIQFENLKFKKSNIKYFIYFSYTEAKNKTTSSCFTFLENEKDAFDCGTKNIGKCSLKASELLQAIIILAEYYFNFNSITICDSAETDGINLTNLFVFTKEKTFYERIDKRFNSNIKEIIDVFCLKEIIIDEKMFNSFIEKIKIKKNEGIEEIYELENIYFLMNFLWNKLNLDKKINLFSFFEKGFSSSDYETQQLTNLILEKINKIELWKITHIQSIQEIEILKNFLRLVEKIKTDSCLKIVF